MGHDHAPAAVPLAAELVQSIAVVGRCQSARPRGVCAQDIGAGTYPSLSPSSSMSLTNFSQRSPVTWTRD